MTKEIITVIGSTGNIGHELINILSTAGKSVRAVLRNFSQARPLPGVTWLQTDVSDESVLDSTLAGTDKLFILTGNNPGFGQTQINVIRAAERLGVKHIVKLSALGASSRTQSPLAYEHWQTEQALQESSMSWTILRPHVFMQNWLGEVAQTVKAENAIYAAIGDGKVSFIDARDIAAVAAQALIYASEHSGKTYILTGDEAIGYSALAEAISSATGKNVVYKSLSMDEMRARMEQQGISTKMIDSYLALAAYQKAGGPTERVSTSVREILKRPALTVQDFALKYKDKF